MLSILKNHASARADEFQFALEQGQWLKVVEILIEAENAAENSNDPEKQIMSMLECSIVLHFLGQISSFREKMQKAKSLLDALHFIDERKNAHLQNTFLLIKAHDDYIAGNFSACITTMGKIGSNDLDKNEYAHYLLLKNFAEIHAGTKSERTSPADTSDFTHAITQLVHNIIVFNDNDLLPWEAFFNQLIACGESEVALRETQYLLNAVLLRIQNAHTTNQIMAMYTDYLLSLEKKIPKQYRLQFASHYEFSSAITAPLSLHYQLTRLVDITRDLLTEHDVDSLTKKLLHYLLDYAQMERGFILLSQGKGFTLACSEEFPKELLSELDNSTPPVIAVAKSAAESKEIIFRNDRSKDRFDGCDDHVRSQLVLPITHQNNILGVVYLESRSRSHLEISYLQKLSVTIGIAIHNANKATSTQRVLQHARTIIEKQKNDLAHRYSYENFIGISTRTHALVDQVRKIADSMASIIITGPSGAGKEMVAKLVHFNSERRQAPFVAVNCAAIPENLLESEFFGHEKGAFTGAIETRKGYFEQAQNGTLFLDEIGELPLSMQAKLLRALQELEISPIGSSRTIKISTRIICATNRNLGEMTSDGLFREDLYYRINVVEIKVPALRERREDIPLFVENALKLYARENGTTAKSMAPDALNYLIKYDWPGNVRELINVIYNLCVFVDSPVIGLADVKERSALFQDNVEERKFEQLAEISEHLGNQSLTLADAKKQFEKLQIQQALANSGGQIAAASRQLGMPRPQLSRLVKKYGLKSVSEVS